MSEQTSTNEFSLETAVATAVKIPGVKVSRSKFLAETFSDVSEDLPNIIELGPVEAGITQDELEKLAKKLILKRTSESSILSFAAGIPGGFAMAATIPSDVMQFFGMTLRLAQELSYLYGAQDLWKDGEIDDEKVKNQLILYCGVMFGVSGAAAGVRVLSTQLAKTALKKLPQKALTKTFWYPLIKQIGKVLSIKVTKSTVAQGISKAIPVVGGVISGGLNFASMMPMANRLQETLEKACFNYSESEMEEDFIEIEKASDEDVERETDKIKEKVSNTIKDVGGKFSGAISKIGNKIDSVKTKAADEPKEDVYETLEKLFKLKEMGAISEEEYENKKTELINRI